MLFSLTIYHKYFWELPLFLYDNADLNYELIKCHHWLKVKLDRAESGGGRVQVRLLLQCD